MKKNLESPQLLQVGLIGSAECESAECHTLWFEFTSSKSPTGLAAWLSDREDVYFVAQHCASLSGGFASQSLNAVVAKKLMSGRYAGLFVHDVYGCTIDLLRVASQLGLPCVISLNERSCGAIADATKEARSWVSACLSKAAIVSAPEQYKQMLGEMGVTNYVGPLASEALVEAAIRDVATSKPLKFDYDTYELLSRDHSLLAAMQAPDAKLFQGCERVLDLGCGVGLFLDLLRKSRIYGVGVERSPGIVEYGREMGLDIIEADAVQYIQNNNEKFDGIYCSHFVEHLPVELVQSLLEGMSQTLERNGVLVLVFPDPESIRSQLLGFWRDPEHVRFYHPELITNMCAALGMELEWSSYDIQPHEIVPFTLNPPPLHESTAQEPLKYSLWERVLKKLGLSLNKDYQALRNQLGDQRKVNQDLAARTDQLWAVNKTWAWNDNVVLKFRKRVAE
ncbi:methyltransferase domain-containing protein [Gilvimarinus sp. SDUM040013]|uniref:Methyltransferase domain-containing protein n=1 Tax=Gilvimarinus gilvus TaxID=3058038 RepID=A0ABU4RWG2_9GAMM|nr:methyltransferase domain-containing protein [Gilvimarinus sp. SDUM040013]MDO3385237.1 methyltransferase domain-containing protein [Gilvimarinus sp. SDUM040013]MDX6849220.1 methyltransferase domain-containing protein [Gilvimarinus sp. SDUM040013]